MGILKEIVSYLKLTQPLILKLVDTRCISDGDDAFNLKLSEERANAVKSALISLGVNTKQLSSKGYGEIKPVESNANAEGKSANRRVEFVKM